ncbi:spore coat protein I [Oxobacter pfennigii]|uniref:Spore coat protein I n=1 Tax=Oxobacter pfennigii TaxID=36849 RepID=A0A0P8W963_9CLOT|nr:CotS family spore coat protein [Oxobacter pfennigii]KPU44556.1 spore coat protein I [Oxobacter pfennigii]
MDLSRYRDKAYLVTYELTTDIFELYDIKVDDIVPIRSVYILYTDKGVKVLKKINYSLQELEFTNSVTEHLLDKGYSNIVTYMNTTDGRYYVKKSDGIYVVLNLIKSREADYQNPSDVSNVSRELCIFHKFTRGMKGIMEKRNNLFKWIPDFEKRACDLLKFKEIAQLHEIKTEFDKLYLENVVRYLNQASQSIELLKSSKYEELCKETEEINNICHHNLAHHNVMIDDCNKVYFSDFDNCIKDLRIHDVANIMVKAIKYFNWDVNTAQSILENYSSIDALRKEEVEVLYGFLTFPQDFYEISMQYYMKTKRWDEEDFLSRLVRKAGYYEDRLNFLEYIKSKVKTGI